MALAGSAMSQGNTVTMKLASGESPNPTATFSPTMGPRQVTVGSGPDAHWKVRANGVEALHAELYWDGKILWVRDGGSRSGVYVGVERVQDWRQIYDGTEIAFGQAVFRAQAIGPDAKAPNDVSSTLVGGGRVSQVQPTPAAQPTRDARSAPGAQSPRISSPNQIPSMVISDDSEESTLMFSGDKLQAPSGSPAPLPPRVSAPSPQVRQATLAPPTRPAAAPMIAPAPPPVATSGQTSEATVIRQSPFAPVAEPAKPLPAAGQRASMPYPTAQPSMQGHSEVTPPPVGERTMMATDLQQYINSATSNAPPPPAVNGRVATLAPPTAAFMNQQGFAPIAAPAGAQTAQPSPYAQPSHGDHDDPFGAFPPPPPSQAPEGGIAGKLGVPVRTLVLAGGTLLVAILGLFINPAPKPRPGASRHGAQRTDRERARTERRGTTLSNPHARRHHPSGDQQHLAASDRSVGHGRGDPAGSDGWRRRARAPRCVAAVEPARPHPPRGRSRRGAPLRRSRAAVRTARHSTPRSPAFSALRDGAAISPRPHLPARSTRMQRPTDAREPHRTDARSGSDTRPGARAAVASLAAAFVVSAAGCTPARPPVLYPITLRVLSDARPMPGASLLYHDRVLGTTDSDGTFRLRTTGQEGQLLEFTLRCPDGFTSPAQPLPITLHSTIGLNGQQNEGIMTTAQCPPSQRVAAVIVRTPNRANIKVMYQGHEITRTDAQGYAHMIFRVPPNETLAFRLDTTEQPMLVPASPTQTVTTHDQDDVYVVSQSFEQLAPARAPSRPHGPVHTIIRVPARNGRLF